MPEPTVRVDEFPLDEQILGLAVVQQEQRFSPDDSYLFSAISLELAEIRKTAPPETYMVLAGVTASLLVRLVEAGASFEDMLSRLS